MKRSLLFAPMLCSVLAIGTFAWAQPDPNEAPKGANPPVQIPGGGGGMGMGGAAWQKMTPAQRRAAMQQMTDQTLRGAMTFMGFDAPTQAIITAAVQEQEKSLADVRESNSAVARGLVAKIPDAQMDIALDNLRMAQEDATTARVKQIADLDKKLDFSHKPRLKAFLSLAGIIGDDSASLTGVMGNLMGAMTNMNLTDPPKAQPDAAPAPAPAPAPQPAAPAPDVQ